jgi:serine/threonine-protein kinase RsbW
MVSARVSLCRQETAQLELHPEDWRRHPYRSAHEVPGLLDVVVAAMEGLGFPKRDLFGVRLALEEALVNAIKHGNRGDPAKVAQLRYHVRPEFVLLEVEDEGAGFDPSLVPDPLAPENLERPSGRGLFLIRQYMTWMEHNERGNCITMCKHRSAP